MENIFFISIDTVKTNSPFSDNVHDKYILLAIREAQEILLRPLLGEDLYIRLRTGIEEGTLSPEDSKLMDDYIMPFMLYGTLVRLLPILRTKVGNIGEIIQTDEKVLTLSEPEAENLNYHYTYIMEHYRSILMEKIGNGCSENASAPVSLYLYGKVGK